MDHGHPGGIAHVLQVVIERAQLIHQHHALVDDGAGGQGADIGICILLLKDPAQHIEPAFKVDPGGDVLRAGQKALANPRHGAAGAGAQLSRMAGHGPPAQDGQTFGGSQPVEDAPGALRSHFILRQKEHPHAVVAGVAQRDALFPGPGSEQAVGKLGHDAHAVAGGARGVAARPVGQALHNGQRLVHGAMGGFSRQVHHGADAAALVFQFLVIEGILRIPHGFILHLP